MTPDQMAELKNQVRPRKRPTASKPIKSKERVMSDSELLSLRDELDKIIELKKIPPQSDVVFSQQYIMTNRERKPMMIKDLCEKLHEEEKERKEKKNEWQNSTDKEERVSWVWDMHPNVKQFYAEMETPSLRKNHPVLDSGVVTSEDRKLLRDMKL
ncbi:uncharacterized protein LOC106666449 [Cimex lectularius]|uniref:Uncharacterized protein n=1 Tax=Cimex lectularius TaxID=79782 RepID=A0A8I6TEB4_CIMLE|nr:uncharacterized protein LOC106666449 [Cimex lectularius]